VRFRTNPDGATPIDPDEAEGLIPLHIRTQSELDAWEQSNIIEGLAWAQRQSRRDLLDDSFVRELHRRMFGATWRWAGSYRKSDKNIGIDWRYIPIRLRDLLDDVKVQLVDLREPIDQTILRFHHRLVLIHPFANGNGRHARVMADLLAYRQGRPAFSWGRHLLTSASEIRDEYLASLRRADGRDYLPLFRFARGGDV
jgi:Fic-DOC domain mobile mystery protein B